MKHDSRKRPVINKEGQSMNSEPPGLKVEGEDGWRGREGINM